MIPALALAALAAWALGHRQLPPWPALIVLPVIGSVAAWRGRRAVFELSWDGQRWRVAGAQGKLELMIDLGGWMLLRFRPEASAAGVQWIPVSRHAAGASLHALRAAVYCRTPEPTLGAMPVADGKARAD